MAIIYIWHSTFEHQSACQVWLTLGDRGLSTNVNRLSNILVFHTPRAFHAVPSPIFEVCAVIVPNHRTVVFQGNTYQLL